MYVDAEAGDGEAAKTSDGEVAKPVGTVDADGSGGEAVGHRHAMFLL